MTDAARALVRVSAALARSDRAALDRTLAEAQAVASAVQIEEVLLQSHLFVGYPAMLQAFGVWRERSPATEPTADDGAWQHDARADTAPDRAAADDCVGWHVRGEQVCARVYGGQYERLRANVVALHPALDRWMIADGYGRVLGRPGLDLDVRELCIVALLCAQDAPAQLYAHLRGALNAGAAEAEVESAVVEATAGLPKERAAAARATWSRVRARGRASPGDAAARGGE
jgi:4-carboxymuconolactone decarboxylase